MIHLEIMILTQCMQQPACVLAHTEKHSRRPTNETQTCPGKFRPRRSVRILQFRIADSWIGTVATINNLESHRRENPRSYHFRTRTHPIAANFLVDVREPGAGSSQPLPEVPICSYRQICLKAGDPLHASATDRAGVDRERTK